MCMLFFRVGSRCYQQAAGHSQMNNNLIAAFKPDNKEFPPTYHTVKNLSREVATKFIGGRVGNHFRAADCNLLNRKSLYLWLDHSSYGFYFGQFRHSCHHLSLLIF